MKEAICPIQKGLRKQSLPCSLIKVWGNLGNLHYKWLGVSMHLFLNDISSKSETEQVQEMMTDAWKSRLWA